jgi:polysaccharide pyruvyl transferase WcaK-like protein
MTAMPQQATLPSKTNPRPRPLRVCLMGTPVNSGNRGVLALASSLVNLCFGAADRVEMVLLIGQHNNHPARFRIGGEERSVPLVNCRLSPRSCPADHLAWIVLMAFLYRLLPLASVHRVIARSTPWIRALAEADVVGDVRGGDSFSDIYGMRRFLRGFLMAWSVVLVKGSLVQFPQTYGPYQSRLARRLARYLLFKSSAIIARDKLSLKVAQELVGARKEILLSPDVAFSLEPVFPETIELDPPLAPASRGTRTGSRILGLNVSGLMYHDGHSRDNMFGLKLNYPSFLPALVTALLREHDGELWLVPHNFAPAGTVESDPDVCRALRDQLPAALQSRIRIVSKPYDQHEIKGVIAQCDFFIGSRMHACIAALSQGIPSVGVAYSMKFQGVFDSVGMNEWVIDARHTTNDEAVSRILKLYARRNDVRESLWRRSEDARLQLRDIFGRLLSAASRPSLAGPRR